MARQPRYPYGGCWVSVQPNAMGPRLDNQTPRHANHPRPTPAPPRPAPQRLGDKLGVRRRKWRRPNRARSGDRCVSDERRRDLRKPHARADHDFAAYAGAHRAAKPYSDGAAVPASNHTAVATSDHAGAESSSHDTAVAATDNAAIAGPDLAADRDPILAADSDPLLGTLPAADRDPNLAADRDPLLGTYSATDGASIAAAEPGANHHSNRRLWRGLLR